MKVKDFVDETTVETWEELVSQIQRYANFPNYIYRGQAQSDWLLESTLSRVLKKIKHKNKDALLFSHLENFKYNIRGRRGLNPSSLDENELWALGQHFGLHTPLLDWSKSPFVALFFALINHQKSKTGFRSLWVLNTPDIETINSWYQENGKTENKCTVDLINPLIDENYRLVNQNGVFTKISIDTHIEEWVNECQSKEINWVTLGKINFPESIKAQALVYLNLMNINFSSLFPDLFGSSLSANLSLEQTDYIYKQQDDIWEEHKK